MPPLTAQEIVQEAKRRHQAGRLHEAAALYAKVLEQAPNNTEALHLLGIVAYQQNRHSEAFHWVQKAISANPVVADYHNTLGEVCRALRLPDLAVECYGRAIALRPGYVEARINLGNALQEMGRVDQAIAAYRSAIQMQPGVAGAHNNLGCALLRTGDREAAVRAFRRAIELKADYHEARLNLGNALHESGLLDEAVSVYEELIRLDPDHAGAHWNRALVLLLKGDFARGWAEYEWRWRRKGAAVSPRRLSLPQWNGEDPAGRTILIQAEQGFGDTIQFARYAPLVARRGARVIVECQPELARLLRSLAGVARVLSPAEPLQEVVHLHSPLLSLPRVFGTTLETVPAETPYLRPSDDLVDAWRKRLGPGEGLRVGLAWTGSAANRLNPQRSLPLSALAPLADVKGARFFSLQKGEGAEEAKAPPPGLELMDLAPELDDFADTAALMASLDLVVTIETAAAHLAGAMGRPVWTLIPFVPDWRWLVDREDSPWYPTMRLFRQTARGNWEGVVRRVASELARVAGRV